MRIGCIGSATFDAGRVSGVFRDRSPHEAAIEVAGVLELGDTVIVKADIDLFFCKS